MNAQNGVSCGSVSNRSHEKAQREKVDGFQSKFSCISVSSESDRGTANSSLRMIYNPSFSPSSRDPSLESVTSLISTSTGNSISPQSTMGNHVTAQSQSHQPMGSHPGAAATLALANHRPHSITSECPLCMFPNFRIDGAANRFGLIDRSSKMHSEMLPSFPSSFCGPDCCPITQCVAPDIWLLPLFPRCPISHQALPNKI